MLLEASVFGLEHFHIFRRRAADVLHQEELAFEVVLLTLFVRTVVLEASQIDAVQSGAIER